LAGYADLYGFPLRQVHGGPVLFLDSAKNVKDFLLAHFEPAPQLHQRLACFASRGYRRNEVAEKQKEYLIHATSEWRQIRSAPIPRLEPETALMQLLHPDGDIDRFLNLLKTDFAERRRRRNGGATDLARLEKRMLETVEKFVNTFQGYTVRGVQFDNLTQLARSKSSDPSDRSSPWDEYAKAVLEDMKPKCEYERKRALEKYRYFLMYDTLPRGWQ
jgi:hypothetical protein